MDIILFLINEAGVITFRVFITALAQEAVKGIRDLIKRIKERTAITSTKDGSDIIE